MKDLDKSYSWKELQNMEFRKYIGIKEMITKHVDSLLSKKDKEILMKYEDLNDYPYGYARNRFDFMLGKEKEAFERETEIFNLHKKVNEIRSKINKNTPPNMFMTMVVIQYHLKNR